MLGAAAEAAYHRGDYSAAERLARAGLERAADDDAVWLCLVPLSVAELARGAYAEVIEHSLTAAELAGRSRESLGIAALAAAYSGDLDRARALNDRGVAEAISPTMHAWGAYVPARSRVRQPTTSWPSRTTSAPSTSPKARERLSSSGWPTSGCSPSRPAPAGPHDALLGYREVIDYFARTGNWTHLWVTLRNLADLLRQIGDDQPAALLDAAADRPRTLRPSPAARFPARASRRPRSSAGPGCWRSPATPLRRTWVGRGRQCDHVCRELTAHW